MELNEIKKKLYKENPLAVFVKINNGVAYYTTHTMEEEQIMFEIPITEMGDTDFIYMMSAKHLIRWIVL